MHLLATENSDGSRFVISACFWRTASRCGKIVRALLRTSTQPVRESSSKALPGGDAAVDGDAVDNEVRTVKPGRGPGVGIVQHHVAQASMAVWMAGVLTVVPSPTAP